MSWPASFSEVTQLILDGALIDAGFDDPEFGAFIDYEPLLQPMPQHEVERWLHAWTGGDRAPAARIVPIGMDGSGGTVAVLLADIGDPEDRCPIVFLGSEGERQVLAKDFADFVILLSLGYGPFDVSDGELGGEESPHSSPKLEAYVRRQFPDREGRTAAEVLSDARAALPDFEEIAVGWVEF